MKVTYDSEVDVLRVLFRDTPIEESDEDKPGVILDYDKDENLVGLEVLNASQRVENQNAVTSTDRKIDDIVYELYDLTPEERALVEAGK